MRVILPKAVRDDLIEIQRYIGADSKRQALRVVEKLRAACDSLGQRPLRFPVVRHLAGRPVRRHVWGSYSIFYLVDDQRVTILRVLHSSRDLEQFFPAEEN